MTILPQTYSIIQDDIMRWASTYDGPPYHAALLDPPYHLTSITKRFGKPGSAPAKTGPYNRVSKGFMGASWDGTDESGKGIAFKPETWAALAQHLYPGAFIMAYAGTRGYHRMACAMEDSGLIIHPAMGYLFGSGWPKATRIDTQVDKEAGAKREVVGKRPESVISKKWRQVEGREDLPTGLLDITAATTPLAQAWEGHRYGLQALKPAFEFIAVAQVPYSDRPVDSIVSTGAGALNIDAGRIPIGNETISVGFANSKRRGVNGEHEGWMRPWKLDGEYYASKIESGIEEANQKGRWPANFLLVHSPGCSGKCDPDCPIRLIDEQSGESASRGGYKGKSNGAFGGWGYESDPDKTPLGYNDIGGASRFFYQADWSYEVLEQIEGAAPVFYTSKPSTTEREAGLDNQSTRIRNDHPSVKPISLNKHLASLLLPPDAYAPRRIVCPFSGSGSEMAGAILAGWEEVTGIEQSAHYNQISHARLAWWSQWPGWGQTDVDKILATKEPEQGQLKLFEES